MFRNKRIIYLIVISVLFIVLIALSHYSPKPINWNPTYNGKSKSPYACYILTDMLSIVFPNQIIEENYDGFFVLLDSVKTEKKNIVVITDKFEPDRYDCDALLKFVAKGNDFFVSSTQFNRLFLDCLKVKLNAAIIDTSAFKPGNEVVFLSNPSLRKDAGYLYDRKMPLVSLSAYDTLNTVVLGTNRIGNANFIGIAHGQGKIYFHTQPLVFTNYHLLHGNVEYASKVLSYLPIRKTVWDGYYKSDRYINTSPMRYILSQPSLQAAYYLLLLTLLLYFLVESKRKQRVIPVLKPYENKSLQFVKTIGNLYLKQRDDVDMVRKKSIFFKEFLREHYFLTNISASDECIAIIAAKSGVSIKTVRDLLVSVDYYETAEVASDLCLIQLNRKIEQFYKQCL